MTAGQRLWEFVLEAGRTAYVEEPSVLHSDISRDVWKTCKAIMNLPRGALILDVGCGMGGQMEAFTLDGYIPIGVTTLGAECEAVYARGCEAIRMDMHEVGRLMSGSFSLAWVRHALEHSVCPAFVLSELHRLLKPAGYLYVEVPAPTECGSESNHESNASHYSVMGPSMWRALITRAGFDMLDELSIKFRNQIGEELYYGFICRKAL